MKVYIIDDEQISLFLSRRILVLEGISTDKDIQTFSTAREAFTSLSGCKDEHLPNVLLLDINMPEMDGWQFLEALAPFWDRLYGKCRIFILTSSLSLSDAERAKEHPMVCDFMYKPLNSESARTLSL